jgi:nitrogen fixation NifU-like protein
VEPVVHEDGYKHGHEIKESWEASHQHDRNYGFAWSDAGMRYSQIARNHSFHPRSVGDIPGADGVGELEDPASGDALKVYIKVVDEQLVDVKFRLVNCPAALAACSMVAKLVLGKSVAEAYRLTGRQVTNAFDGCHVAHLYCSNLAVSALREAIIDYSLRRLREIGVITEDAEGSASCPPEEQLA